MLSEHDGLPGLPRAMKGSISSNMRNLSKLSCNASILSSATPFCIFEDESVTIRNRKAGRTNSKDSTQVTVSTIDEGSESVWKEFEEASVCSVSVLNEEEIEAISRLLQRNSARVLVVDPHIATFGLKKKAPIKHIFYDI
jgi:hypothetical protein